MIATGNWYLNERWSLFILSWCFGGQISKGIYNFLSTFLELSSIRFPKCGAKHYLLVFIVFDFFITLLLEVPVIVLLKDLKHVTQF